MSTDATTRQIADEQTSARSPARRARELTHKLAAQTAAEGDVWDFVEYQGAVGVHWSALNAAIATEVAGGDVTLPAGGDGR